MRLIDADAINEMCDGIIEHEWNHRAAPVCWADAYEDFKDDIGNIPTIPAITIDWLDAQIRGYASALKSTELHALLVVKRLWEQDQNEPKEENNAEHTTH